MARRLRAAIRRTGLVALAAIVPAGWPIGPGAARAHQPTTVALGIGGVHRTAAWTPLVIRMPIERAATGVRAWVEDADGQFVGSPPASFSADADGMVAHVCVRPGRPTVRVLLEELAGAGEGNAAGGPPRGAVAAIDPRPGTALTSTTPLLLVRGSVPAAAAAARLVAGEATAMAVVQLEAEAAGVLRGPRDLDAFDAAIVCGTAVADLEGEALAALDGWVRRGGRLVFAAGGSAVELAAAGGRAAEWLPGREPRLVPLRRLAAIEAYARSGGLARRLPAAGLTAPRFEAAGGLGGLVEAFEGASANELPLVVRRGHGFGTITWIGLDIDQPWCADWPGCDRLVAALLGGRSEADLAFTPAKGRRQVPDLAGQLRVALDAFPAAAGMPASAPVPFEVIAGLGVLYCLALYPFDWWIVRRAGRPWLSWVTLPLLAGGFAAAAWAVGAAWGRDAPARLRVAEVIDCDAASGLVRGSAWAAARSPANGRLDVTVTGDAGLAGDRCDAAVSWWADAGAGFGAVDAAVAHPSLAEAGYAYGASLASLEAVPVAAASSRLFEAGWFGQAGRPAADATLVRDGRGLLTGSVTSRLTVPLEQCWLVHGGWLYDVGRMKPGDTFDTEAGRGPRSLAAALTRRTAVKDRDRAERWDATTGDVGRILEVAGLHAAAGGPGYTGLEAGGLGRLDLSPLVAGDRAVLVGTVPAGTRLTTWTVRLGEDRAPSDLPPEPAAAGLVRIVLPVRTAAPEVVR